MKVLIVYARLYGDCLMKTLVGIGKNAWTLLLPMVLVVGFILAASLLVGGLGIVGGILTAFIRSALMGSYLYFVGEIVSHARVGIAEFGRSIRVYFWSVVNLFFVLWIVDLVLGGVVKDPMTARLLDWAVTLLVFVLMPSLEVIALRGSYGGLATLQRAFEFLQEHWIEWFVPNALMAGLGYLLLYRTPLLDLGLFAGIPLGFLLHLAMVFRGNLFNALDGSSHRQRMFKYRNQLS